MFVFIRILHGKIIAMEVLRRFRVIVIVFISLFVWLFIQKTHLRVSAREDNPPVSPQPSPSSSAQPSSGTSAVSNQKIQPFIFPGPDDLYKECGDDMNCFIDSISQYKMTCSPQIKFTPYVDGAKKEVQIGSFEGSLEDYCGDANVTDPRCIFDVGSGRISLLEGDLILPLMRNVKANGDVNETVRTSSMETFIAGGTKQSSSEDVAPIEKLLPLQQICHERVQLLKTIKALCDDDVLQGEFVDGQENLIQNFLGNNGEEQRCSLDQKIGDAYYTDVLEDIAQLTGNGNELQYCESGYFQKPTTPELKTLVDKIQKVRPTLSNAFKKAYIVEYSYSQLPPTTPHFKVIPVLVPVGFASQESDTDLPPGMEGKMNNGPYTQALSSILPSKALEDAKEQVEEDNKQIATAMRSVNTQNFRAPSFIELPMCKQDGLSREQQQACAIAKFINISITRGDFEGPDGNTTCTFSGSKDDQETAVKRVTRAKPNFLQRLVALFTGDSSNTIGSFSDRSFQYQETKEGAKDVPVVRVFFVGPGELKLISQTEKLMYQAIVPESVQLAEQERIDADLEANSGYLRMNNLRLQVSGGSAKTFINPNAGEDGEKATVEVRGTYRPNGDPNPLLPGGWLARFMKVLTANVAAPKDSKLYQKDYPRKQGLEPYWDRIQRTSEDGKYDTCEDYEDATMIVPSITKVEEMICSIAAAHGISANMLNGLFRIESGTSVTDENGRKTSFRAEAFRLHNEGRDGETVELPCKVNPRDGSFPPLNIMLNDCRVKNDLPANGEPENVNGRNLCDIENALDILAGLAETYGTVSAYQRPDTGEPNPYWIAGHFGIGGNIKNYKDEINPPYKCAFPEDGDYARWAHVDGCIPGISGRGTANNSVTQSTDSNSANSGSKVELDYCSCAVENFPVTCN